MPSIGFALPGTALDTEPDTALRFARRAESVGAHSVWVMDRIMDRTPDPFVTLGAVAATTSRVLLGTSVVLGVLRSPLLLAKAAASVDRLSNGRFQFGMGVGSRPEDFLATHVPLNERGARMEELLSILKLAWSGAAVRYQGRFHSYDLGPMGVLPVQKPHIPLWFGGGADSVLRRVGEVGAGYISSTSGGLEGFRANWQRIRQCALAAGRDPSAITPAALVHYSLHADGDRAREAMRDFLSATYAPGRVALGLGKMVGTPDDLVRGAQEYFGAGAELLILSSITANVAHLDLFCERVLPRLVAEAGVRLRLPQ